MKIEPNKISVRVLAHSVTNHGTELISFLTRAPKFIDAELRTHRQLSQNSSSSRAKPVDKVAGDDYYVPTDIRKAQSGMQGYEPVCRLQADMFRRDVRFLRHSAEAVAYSWSDEVHKQHVNRYLEAWAWQDKVITATELDNFFKLRTADDVQPETQQLALLMLKAREESTPSRSRYHHPFLSIDERSSLFKSGYSWEDALAVSAARCARTSYSNHDGSTTIVTEDLALAEWLIENKHLTPFEHQATPMDKEYWNTRYDIVHSQDGVTHGDKYGYLWSGNFRGWVQNRQVLQ